MRVKPDGKFGFINTSGEWAIPPKFDRLGGFDETGLASVHIDGKKGLIDRLGKFVILLE